jgi:UDP:flavonoid glycosyltransferase YjiC (YdhE family)
MKIVVTGYGTTGDTQPLIALASGLQQAGHQVVLVTDEGAVAPAARLGVDCRVLAGSARTMVTEGSQGWSETVKTGRPSMRLVVRAARLNTRAWIETIHQAADGADVIVATTLVVYHAASVAQQRGIPVVFGQLQPSLETKDYPPPLSGIVGNPAWLNRPLAQLMSTAGDLTYRGAINQARRELGQSRLRLVWDELPILAAWSPTLVPPSADWAHPDVTVTGPWLPPPDDSWQPPDDLADFLDAGEPPIYVGFGSMAGVDTRPLRDAILDGLSDRRVLLSAGWADLTDVSLPANVHPIGWAPHQWIFPRCAAIMHHCGAGTTHQSAGAGVPTIPMPFLGDQPFWADRLCRLGIATPPLNPRKATGDAIREAAHRADADELKTAARAVAARLASEPDGVETVTRRIERCVRE